MTIEISEEVRRQASQCPHDFACLEDGACSGCEVSGYARGQLFVRGQAPHCPYFLPFANGGICGCPVYVELFRRRDA
jgi:hypothetical protein